MRHRLVTIAVFVLVIAGCNKKQSVDKVTYVDEDDPQMNAAIEKARSSVNKFIAALQSPKAGRSDFSVKMAFTDRNGTEHMWLSPVSYDGNKFHGTVNNEPETVKNVRMGKKVTVEPSKISDWMYVEKGKLVGGYTLRVLRDKMSPKERAEFDRSVPFVIE